MGLHCETRNTSRLNCLWKLSNYFHHPANIGDCFEQRMWSAGDKCIANQMLVNFVLMTTTETRALPVMARLVYPMQVSHVLMQAFNDIQSQIDLLSLRVIYILSN